MLAQATRAKLVRSLLACRGQEAVSPQVVSPPGTSSLASSVERVESQILVLRKRARD